MGKNKKVIGFMKDELGRQIMKKFVRLRAKTCSYLKDNNGEDKKAKRTKKCVVKRNLKFRYYKKCLKASQIENKIKYLEKKKIDVYCLKEDKKEFIKNKLTLKTNKDLKVKNIMFFLKSLTRLL